MNNQYYSNWIELLQSRTLHQPSQTAFIFLQDDEISKETLTYQQLDIKARTIAAYLQERFTTGERALLLYPSGLDYVVAFFGCLYAGIIAVPLYPPRNNRNRSRIESVLTDSQATIALTTSSVLSKVGEQGDSNHNLSNLHWLATDLLDNELGNQWQNLLVKGDTIAYLQYTSGSTATPKGVIITHENALHNSADMSISWETRLDSVLVSWLPHFHDFGQVYGILQPIYKGFPCILMPPTCFVQQPIRWLKALQNSGQTSI
jgi:acyl-CoA synthetase (AMP-forming)/AMP-acid ligase II